MQNVSGVSPKQLHVALAAKLGALRSRAQVLDGATASHGGQGSAKERRLMTALQEAHSVITDQARPCATPTTPPQLPAACCRLPAGYLSRTS